MLRIQVEPDQVRIGERFAVTFQRTLRIPDDGRVYPLPPGLGPFPIQRVADYADRVPAHWLAHGGVFIPVYQREALWLGFEGAWWKPNAVKIGVGRINAVSGESWDETLHADPQDYLVCPDQPWLDGINAGEGMIRQFVAMPLGQGYSVEGQLTGKEEFGGIQILVFEPKPGRFPDQPPKRVQQSPAALYASSPEMGVAAGGQMKQKIYPDSYGIDVWDTQKYGILDVYLVDSEQYQVLTDQEAPPTPISAQTYTDYGFPWFDLYDEDQAQIAASQRLSRVKTVKETDRERGLAERPEDMPVKVRKSQVKKLRR